MPSSGKSINYIQPYDPADMILCVGIWNIAPSIDKLINYPWSWDAVDLNLNCDMYGKVI